MAGIKSTMDLVMERAARMGMASTDELRQEEEHKKGMQRAAEFLNGKTQSLTEVFQQQQGDQQMALRKGMLEALIRNLFLPRDDEGGKRLGRAIQGLTELNKGASDIASLCKELQTITGQYRQHRDQIYEQLKDQLRMQIQQVLARQTGVKPDLSKIDPTMEPRFKEEWSRVEQELENQYAQALEQYKTELRQRSGI